MNGDRRVDIADVSFFSLAYFQSLNYNAALDFNGDGRIDVSDFGQYTCLAPTPRQSALGLCGRGGRC